MDSHEHHLGITYQARYYTYGNLSGSTKNIWFVIHGYGQLAKYFIKKFEVLDPDENFVVAPEGLSRFYLQGFEGRTGATWMTREDRLTDIRNYVSYLDTLYSKVIPPKNTAAINILGFSQGAATVCRWITEGNISFNRLILWAGIFPPDLEIKAARQSLSDKPVQLIIGDQDDYLTPERIDEMEKISRILQVKPEIIKYSGGHHIDSKILLRLASFY